MKNRSHLITAFALAAAFSLPASIAYSQQTSEHPAVLWFLREKAKIEQRLALNQQLEIVAQEALARAQNALANAERLHDGEARPVAQRAVDKAQLALQKARKLLREDGSRLAAIRDGLETLRAIARIRERPFPAIEPAPGAQSQTHEMPISRETPLGARGYTPSDSEGEVAIVTLITGNLSRKSGDTWVSFHGNVPIRPGDEIKTDPGSSVELMFTDGSQQVLGSNSTFKAAELNERRSVYELVTGKLRVVRKCFDLNVSTAEMVLCQRSLEHRLNNFAVTPRGTEFILESASDGRNIVTVLEGSVEVTGLNHKRTVTASASQQVSTTPEGKLTGPGPVDLRSISRWWEE